MSETFERKSSRRGCGLNPKIIIALVLAAISIITYFSSTQVNPVTGEKQHVNLKVKDEVALGLQAAPQMAQQFGGPSSNREGQALVEKVGNKIVQNSDAVKGEYPFQFHLLDDDKTVNAFALPGGQVFITDALFDKLQTEGELAGVLAHEITHVVGRHGAEHMAKQALQQGLTGAAVIAAADPNNPNSTQRNAVIAGIVGSMISMKYGREDEHESDNRGVHFMAQAGYDPTAMIKVMEILREAGGGGSRKPEWMNSHPDPGNRIESIKAAIAKEFPNGIPATLTK